MKQIIILCSALLSSPVFAAQAKSFSPFVNNEGHIVLPDDFRKNMSHLGSWFVPEGGASGFHDVYTPASVVESFRKSGKFPDGAVMIKELRHATKGTFTTGANVAYANDNVKQWFVMVKDTKNRFSESKNWGDGWGWALFKPGDTKTNVSTDYKQDCLGCHLPVRDKDLIYVDSYPTLK